MWSLLFVGAGLLVGTALGINPILRTFGLNTNDNEIRVVVDAGHRGKGYALVEKVRYNQLLCAYKHIWAFIFQEKCYPSLTDHMR